MTQPNGATAPVRVLLAEPNPLVVSALTVCFDQDKRFRLAGSVGTGQEVLDHDPTALDVVVLAWQLADMGAPDVLRAIVYLVQQQYETGQALPVTGGQTMLS